jgi:DNA-binding NarL/FixJ family response regulator
MEAVAAHLEAVGIDVVARATEGELALAKIEERRPDVALIDLRMPRMNGIEIVRQALRVSPDTAVVLYTGYGDQALLREALDVGARGFVLKEAPMEDLTRAILTVASGGVYIDPVLAGAVATAAASAAPKLTQREREVLRLLADGLANEEIGKRLFISPETVRTHVRKAMDKLEADTRTQAVARALRDNLIS